MTNKEYITLEELTEKITALNAAKLAYEQAQGDSNPHNAYRHDPAVKKQADAIFKSTTYLFKASIRNKGDIARLRATNSSHIGWGDIEAIALQGDFKNPTRFGGLMGAILTADPNRSPKEILSYFKLRMYGEVIDAFRQRLGRPGGKKVSYAKQLSSFTTDEGTPSLDIEDQRIAPPGSALVEAEYLHGVLLALETLKEPYKAPVADFLQGISESGDIDAVLEERGARDLSRSAQGDDKLLRQGLLLLKVAYLNLDDSVLPEIIVNAKREVLAKKSEWETYSDSAFAFAKTIGFTLQDMGDLTGVTESRMSQIQKKHNISYELLGMLGLAVKHEDIRPPLEWSAAAQEYINTAEASTQTGIRPLTIISRAARMEPQKDYTPDGRTPDADYKGETVKGSALVGKVFGSNRWILNLGLVNAWGAAEKKSIEHSHAGWLSPIKAATNMSITPDALSIRAKNIDPDKKYLPDGTQPKREEKQKTVRGNEIIWRHPYNPSVVLLSPEYLAAQDAAEKKTSELKEQGWVILKEAAASVGISENSFGTRSTKISSEKNYLPNGRLPRKNSTAETIAGSDLIWRHPYSSGVVLASPTYVQTMGIDEKKYKEVEADPNYLRLIEAAEDIGINPEAMAKRISDVKPDGSYKPDGSQLEKGKNGKTIKGSELIYRDPHSQAVWVKKELVTRHKSAEKERKKLQKQGYVRSGAIAAQINEAVGADVFEVQKIQRFGARIKEGTQYLPDGTKPTKGAFEETVDGATIRWANPFNPAEVLYSPAFAEGVKAAAVKDITLERSDYLDTKIVAQALGIPTMQLGQRLKGIDPEGDYSPSGLPAEEAPGEQMVKGAQLVWRHPYAKKTLMAGALIEGMKEADASLKASGYHSLSDASHMTGMGSVAMRNRLVHLDPEAQYLPDATQPPAGTKSDKTIKGAVLVVKHPYCPELLVHDAYVQAHMQKNVKKGGKLELLGEVKTLPPEIEKELEAKHQQRAL